MARSQDTQPITVYGAMVANFVIAITKFVAATISGSSAMLSEGIHSLVDTGNQLLLLLGIRRAERPPDEAHPFGHGKELYFWGLIVAIILFSLGGGMSIYEGLHELVAPAELASPLWSYVVLGIAALFEGGSWTIAVRETRAQMRPGESFWKAFRTSKDPSVYTVVAEDSAALLGLVVAFLGVWLSHRLADSIYDAVASMMIGIILIVVAVILTIESHGLLIGESADVEVRRDIRRIAEDDPAVRQVRALLTMHLGPNEVLVNMHVAFEPDLTSDELSQAVDRLEREIRTEHGMVRQLFIDADSLRGG